MNLAPVPLKASQILKNIDRWRSDAYTADLDLAELMRHFNGIHYGWEPKTEQQIAEIVERLKA